MDKALRRISGGGDFKSEKIAICFSITMEKHPIHKVSCDVCLKVTEVFNFTSCTKRDLKKKQKLLYVFPVELGGMQRGGFELQQPLKMPEAKGVEAVCPLKSMTKTPLPVSKVRV